MDRIERILYPLSIALILLLLYTQIFVIPANRRLQVQIDTLKAETILRHSEALERVEYRTHPENMNKRQIDWMLKQGEFAE